MTFRILAFATVLAVSASTVQAQDASNEDFQGIDGVLGTQLGQYLREGFDKGDVVADDVRYPAFTTRVDPLTGDSFFSKFGGDTHRLRASRKGDGIFNLFK